jgi:hypothetical protein
MNYLTDAVKSMESEKKEGFYVELTGPTLIARADELLGKAASMKQELKDLNALVDKENDMIKIINSRTKKESKGGNPAERDADMMRLSMG